jgi:hypothetical protein
LKNYFNYFTEIEEHFQRRRGTLLMLSTLDWALIETWREAGVPLEAVLRGIDAAFDKYDARKSHARVRRVNGLGYCTQEVMAAVESMKEASVGSSTAAQDSSPAAGFEQQRIADHLHACAKQLRAAKGMESSAVPISELAQRLDLLAGEVLASEPALESLERTLTVMEEKMFALLVTSASESELTALREEAARELAPYRSRMQSAQIRQVEQQFLHKKLLERNGLPRLSLFYMSQG